MAFSDSFKKFFQNIVKTVPDSYLGIDIGTSSVKLAELGKERGRAKLLTFGEAGTYYALERLTDISSLKSHQITDSSLIQLLQDLIKATQAKSRSAVFSLPLGSSFSTTIEFPNMGASEIQRAIEYEARQYIPLPLSEVTMSSHILTDIESTAGETGKKDDPGKKIEVLLVAVPNEIIERYKNVALNAGLEIAGMELESFSVVRSVLGNDKMTALVVDIGSHVSNISFVERGYTRIGHNMDIGSSDMTRVISQSLNIPLVRAEELKKTFGLIAQGGEKEVSNLMFPIVDMIVLEAQKILDSMARKHKDKKVDRIILVGGGAILPGLSEYVSNRLGILTNVANPFSRIIYPAEIDSAIHESGPSYCSAVGLALSRLT